MNPSVTMTDEQFQTLLAEVRTRGPAQAPSSPVGVGKVLGLGQGPMGLSQCSDGLLAAGVWAMLAGGSPRLALAKAIGVPLAPYYINIKATFESTDTVDIPAIGSDVKIVQDTLIDALLIRTVNESATANLNQFQAQSDWFYNFQSGLEATLDVQGAPRYAVAPRFTLLSTIADMVSGQSHWPGGWILTYQQQLWMAFHARVTLPYAPITVHATFRGWIPVTEAFVSMTNREALDSLAKDCGIEVTDAYRNRVLNR
jgi:hypothetical protein